MACHHRQSHPTPTNTTTCFHNFCCCCSCHSCSPPQVSHPLQDPLLHALAAHILHSDPLNHEQHHHHDPYSQSTKLNTHNLHPQNPYQNHQRRSQNQPFQETHGTGSMLSSLLRRIESLESSLLQVSTSSPSPYSCSPYSLRDLSARVIQIHFRAFLVRRSRTLRHLKDLAVIKSTFNSLKSSLSTETHFDCDALSHKAMDLLLKLDTIQGGDPMIREGKRSISRDLVRFLEFMDEVSVKRHRLSFKTIKNVSFGHPNGDKSRVSSTKIKSMDGQRDMIKKLRARVEKISELSKIYQNEENTDLEGFQQVSYDDEENPTRFAIRGNNGRISNGVLVKRKGVQSKVKKSVSFADNGNVYRIYSDIHEPISSEDGTCLDDSISSGHHGEEDVTKTVCKGFPQGTEDDEKAHSENGESPQSSDGEISPRRISRREGSHEIGEHIRIQNGNYAFSAPLPLKMESKAGTR
ncbi:hypothetical protein I3842_04G058100 [Carya illinoinensis]|uniref:BAG family molecular chaperone regulator 8, chloroplastic n=1 Tax=Carya illinoinensis TaxID=32201 RepID=A0A922F753_CARIL|nr:hypothetical protein I3842_04G058100 [Carya illinoinensis]